MVCCILVLYLAAIPWRPTPLDRPVPGWPGSIGPAVEGLPQAAQPGPEDPDVLYRQREDPTAARRAERIWAERRQRAGSAAAFEDAWKQARAAYWLGTHEATKDARRHALERGMDAARAAIGAAPNRPEGHFWLAANMGALAESFGLRMGLRYRGNIKRELETVLKIDPTFQLGSADRALGRWYHMVPGLFGGSEKKSEEHLRRSLAYDPTSHASLFFLAETLLEMDREADARAALEKLIAAPIHDDWAPEDREFKQKALALLKSIEPNP